MHREAEKNRLKFELQMVQNEINRWHLLVANSIERARNHEKFSALLSRKHRIQQQLCALRI